MTTLSIRIWRNRGFPVRHGFTAATEDDIATLRLGPMVIGWEVTEG